MAVFVIKHKRTRIISYLSRKNCIDVRVVSNESCWRLLVASLYELNLLTLLIFWGCLLVPVCYYPPFPSTCHIHCTIFTINKIMTIITYNTADCLQCMLEYSLMPMIKKDWTCGVVGGGCIVYGFPHLFILLRNGT